MVTGSPAGEANQSSFVYFAFADLRGDFWPVVSFPGWSVWSLIVGEALSIEVLRSLPPARTDLSPMRRLGAETGMNELNRGWNELMPE